MSLNDTPRANRLHIGIYGKRNSGKSSLINALTGQDIALVSDAPGATTDPVFKSMELHPLGPVVFIDTAGFDDEGQLGKLRVERTQSVVDKTDIAIVVVDGMALAEARDAAMRRRGASWEASCLEPQSADGIADEGDAGKGMDAAGSAASLASAETLALAGATASAGTFASAGAIDGADIESSAQRRCDRKQNFDMADDALAHALQEEKVWIDALTAKQAPVIVAVNKLDVFAARTAEARPGCRGGAAADGGGRGNDAASAADTKVVKSARQTMRAATGEAASKTAWETSGQTMQEITQETRVSAEVSDGNADTSAAGAKADGAAAAADRVKSDMRAAVRSEIDGSVSEDADGLMAEGCERGCTVGEKFLEGIAEVLGGHPAIAVSAAAGLGLGRLRKALEQAVPEDFLRERILGDLIEDGGLALLVMPQDIQAPKGRLILPQVQTIRELLDRRCTTVATTVDGMEQALAVLRQAPDLIITDSQCFDLVYGKKPAESALTSFSVLFAAYKGDIDVFVRGAATLDDLTETSRVLIAEACTHVPLSEDIGREKIPKLLRKRFGERMEIVNVCGNDFPEPNALGEFDLVIHCGGCMFNRKHVMNRIAAAEAAGIPITNYGVALAKLAGILDKIKLPE